MRNLLSEIRITIALLLSMKKLWAPKFQSFPARQLTDLWSVLACA